MPINRVHKTNNQCCYFITPTIKNWYYIFDRHNRWQILTDSIVYFQNNKGLEVYSYVFMLNHLHLIVKSPDMIGFLSYFKKFTTKKLIQNIEEFDPDILSLFRNKNGGYGFWKEDNQPKILESDKFTQQKFNYIHNNPVAKNYVERPEFWKWSSSNPNSQIKVMSL